MVRPVSVAYEYTRPRYRYEFDFADDPPPVEAHYCTHADGRLECREVVSVEGPSDDLRPLTEPVFVRETASVPGFTARRVGEDVWEIEIERRPGLLERLLPGRWPPDPDDRLFDDAVDERALVHPDPTGLSVWTHETAVY
jgi:hypothetical protein